MLAISVCSRVSRSVPLISSHSAADVGSSACYFRRQSVPFCETERKDHSPNNFKRSSVRTSGTKGAMRRPVSWDPEATKMRASVVLKCSAAWERRHCARARATLEPLTVRMR